MRDSLLIFNEIKSILDWLLQNSSISQYDYKLIQNRIANGQLINGTSKDIIYILERSNYGKG